jgi:hypothetical protein
MAPELSLSPETGATARRGVKPPRAHHDFTVKLRCSRGGCVVFLR